MCPIEISRKTKSNLMISGQALIQQSPTPLQPNKQVTSSTVAGGRQNLRIPSPAMMTDTNSDSTHSDREYLPTMSI